MFILYVLWHLHVKPAFLDISFRILLFFLGFLLCPAFDWEFCVYIINTNRYFFNCVEHCMDPGSSDRPTATYGFNPYSADDVPRATRINEKVKLIY